MLRRIDRAKAERASVAYAELLAGFGAFTLYRYETGRGRLYDQAAYRGDDPAEVAQLRRLLAARPSGRVCACPGGAAISLEGGGARVMLTIHHRRTVSWRGAASGATYGYLVLKRRHQLTRWLAARGVIPER
jgi:hypothetical protein